MAVRGSSIAAAHRKIREGLKKSKSTQVSSKKK